MKEYIRNLALGLWIGLRARAQQALNDANVSVVQEPHRLRIRWYDAVRERTGWTSALSYTGWKRFGLGLDFRLDGAGDDEEVWNLRLGPVQAFFGRELYDGSVGMRLRRLGYQAWHAARWGAELYRFDSDWVFTWSWAANDSERSSDTPWWRYSYVNLADAIFGSTSCDSKVVWEGEVFVPLPEGVYKGKGKLQEYTHRKPRWPGVWTRFYREHIDVPQGIDHSGKHGTTFGMSPRPRGYRGTKGAFDAVGAMVGSVMEDRGGDPTWRPERRVRRRRRAPGSLSPFIQEPRSSTTRWLYEERDPLTGIWSSIGFKSPSDPAITSARLAESGCGCCQAEYGMPCTSYAVDRECPNLRLREENPQYVPQEQSA